MVGYVSAAVLMMPVFCCATCVMMPLRCCVMRVMITGIVVVRVVLVMSTCIRGMMVTVVMPTLVVATKQAGIAVTTTYDAHRETLEPKLPAKHCLAIVVRWDCRCFLVRENKANVTILSLEVNVDDCTARTNSKESILGPCAVRFAVQPDRFAFAIATPHTAHE